MMLWGGPSADAACPPPQCTASPTVHAPVPYTYVLLVSRWCILPHNKPAPPINPGASPQVGCSVDIHHQLLPHVRDDYVGGCVATPPQVLEQGAQLTHTDVACRGEGGGQPCMR